MCVFVHRQKISTKKIKDVCGATTEVKYRLIKTSGQKVNKEESSGKVE